MNRSAKELAAAVGATLEGNGALELSAVASPERAGPRDLIYADSAKNASRAQASAATCVIAPSDLELTDKTILRSATPKLAFAKAAALLMERTPIATGVHSTAIIAALAQISSNVSIGPYAVIGEDVHIGENTQIGPHRNRRGCWIGKIAEFIPRHVIQRRASGRPRGSSLRRRDWCRRFGYAFASRRWKFRKQELSRLATTWKSANTTIDRGSSQTPGLPPA